MVAAVRVRREYKTCLIIYSSLPLFGHEAIWRDGTCVGYLLRAEYAYTLKKTVACGLVKSPEGTTIIADDSKKPVHNVEVMGKLITAAHLMSYNPRLKSVKK